MYGIIKDCYTPHVVCYIIWYNQLDFLPSNIPARKFVLVQILGFLTHSLNGEFCECFPPLESKLEGFRMKTVSPPPLKSIVGGGGVIMNA